MELWIRSQEGNVLIPIHSKLELLYDAPKHVLIISDETILGAYDSRERVLEVLDEIQKLLMPTIEYNPMVKKEESWEEEYQRTILKGYDVKIEQAITYVYEMPKE